MPYIEHIDPAKVGSLSPAQDLGVSRPRTSHMRRWLVGLAVVGTLSMATAVSARESRARGPWRLVSLAALGTVTWRCDPAARPHVSPGLPALALGFRVERLGQTGHLALTIGPRTVVSRSIQPGQVIALPYLAAPIQRLTISEGGEDGTLHATILVAFNKPSASNYCWPYMPPEVHVDLSGRR
jgi:hypothetical protein